MKIALIISDFNKDITQELCNGAKHRWQEKGYHLDDLYEIWVPGAVELPIVAQKYVKTGLYDAVICLGAVIRGETSHYDYVCQQVSYGCQRVALDYEIPVIFGVLTTESEEQAWERVGGIHGHKGQEAVDTALSMIAVMKVKI